MTGVWSSEGARDLYDADEHASGVEVRPGGGEPWMDFFSRDDPEVAKYSRHPSESSTVSMSTPLAETPSSSPRPSVDQFPPLPITVSRSRKQPTACEEINLLPHEVYGFSNTVAMLRPEVLPKEKARATLVHLSLTHVGDVSVYVHCHNSNQHKYAVMVEHQNLWKCLACNEVYGICPTCSYFFNKKSLAKHNCEDGPMTAASPGSTVSTPITKNLSDLSVSATSSPVSELTRCSSAPHTVGFKSLDYTPTVSPDSRSRKTPRLLTYTTPQPKRPRPLSSRESSSSVSSSGSSSSTAVTAHHQPSSSSSSSSSHGGIVRPHISSDLTLRKSVELMPSTPAVHTGLNYMDDRWRSNHPTPHLRQHPESHHPTHHRHRSISNPYEGGTMFPVVASDLAYFNYPSTSPYQTLSQQQQPVAMPCVTTQPMHTDMSQPQPQAQQQQQQQQQTSPMYHYSDVLGSSAHSEDLNINMFHSSLSSATDIYFTRTDPFNNPHNPHSQLTNDYVASSQGEDEAIADSQESFASNFEHELILSSQTSIQAEVGSPENDPEFRQMVATIRASLSNAWTNLTQWLKVQQSESNFNLSSRDLLRARSKVVSQLHTSMTYPVFFKFVDVLDYFMMRQPVAISNFPLVSYGAAKIAFNMCYAAEFDLPDLFPDCEPETVKHIVHFISTTLNFNLESNAYMMLEWLKERVFLDHHHQEVFESAKQALVDWAGKEVWLKYPPFLLVTAAVLAFSGQEWLNSIERCLGVQFGRYHIDSINELMQSASIRS